jgi:hypothetical protein
MAIIDHESITNEARLHEIAGIIHNEFYMESIKEQIFAGLEATTTDYLKSFNIKLKEITDNYDENDYTSIIDFRDELYHNIITWIQEKYDITIQYQEDEIAKIVKQFYRFFAVDMKDAVTAFLHYYIVENYKDILAGIDDARLNFTQVDMTAADDIKLPRILITNLGAVIDTVIGMGITFETFIRYAATSGEVRSVNELYSASESTDGILAISNEDSIFGVIMQEMHDNIFDHNIVVQLSTMLISSLGIEVTPDETISST